MKLNSNLFFIFVLLIPILGMGVPTDLTPTGTAALAAVPNISNLNIAKGTYSNYNPIASSSNSALPLTADSIQIQEAHPMAMNTDNVMALHATPYYDHYSLFSSSLLLGSPLISRPTFEMKTEVSTVFDSGLVFGLQQADDSTHHHFSEIFTTVKIKNDNSKRPQLDVPTNTMLTIFGLGLVGLGLIHRPINLHT